MLSQLVQKQLDINPNLAYLRATIAGYFAKLGQPRRALDELEDCTISGTRDASIFHLSVVVYDYAVNAERHSGN